MAYASEPLTVAAVLTPIERQRVEAAASGVFAVVHRESVREAARVVRERPVDAILISVHRCGREQADAVRHLVHDFPGIPTLALLSQHDARASEMLLTLGASGVRQVVDVSSPAGWTNLRSAVNRPASRSASRIQQAVIGALGPVPPDTRFFFETLIRIAPETPTVRKLASVLRVQPSTLMSRFARSDLPSPKNYLASVRLLHAAYLFQSQGLSIADVAYRLDYSSPQSFGRHLRTMLGVTSSEFRERCPFPVALERFVTHMITPYGRILKTFHPLVGESRGEPFNRR